MSLEKKLRLLEAAFGPSYHSGKEYLFRCPKCNHHKKKLSVNLLKNVYKCWICSLRGRNILKLFKYYSNKELRNKWIELNDYFLDTSNKQEIEYKEVILPEDYCFIPDCNPILSLEARKYLKGRGISLEDIYHWKLGISLSGDYANRVIAPSFNSYGSLDYFVGRSWLPYGVKYINPDVSKDIIFNDLMVDWSEDVVLVEGVFDAIKAGSNAIPLLGSSMEEESELFQKICRFESRVYLALDQDARKKQLRIMRKFIANDIEVYDIDVSPFNDVGEMTKEQFLQKKEEAEPISESDLLRLKLELV